MRRNRRNCQKQRDDRELTIKGKEERSLDVLLGDVLEMKKEHPCGSKRWQVLRVGMDFRLRCEGCGHEVMLPRRKAEKSIKKILRGDEDVTTPPS